MSSNYQHQMAFTVPQVAEILGGLSVSFVYRVIREGKLPSKKLAGRIMVSKKALEDFLETPDVKQAVDDKEEVINVTSLFPSHRKFSI